MLVNFKHQKYLFTIVEQRTNKSSKPKNKPVFKTKEQTMACCVMEEVKTSSSGIIKNILSLNYTIEDVVKEYLNNVLSKNENNSEYEIEMFFKSSKVDACFDFIEKGSGNPKGLDVQADSGPPSVLWLEMGRRGGVVGEEVAAGAVN